MKRGDLITVVMPGAYGKPRPALVIQDDRYLELDSVTFLPLTSDVLPDQIFRLNLEPSPANGLQSRSQIMVDKCSTLPASKIGPPFGRITATDLAAVNQLLASFLGIT